MTGPLAGVRVIELAAIGPAPFAAMFLGELGSDVVRIDRPDGTELTAGSERVDLTNRGKRSIVLDLRQPDDVERLGLGPADCFAVNERLVYGRMTGWGQTGPLASAVGHGGLPYYSAYPPRCRWRGGTERLARGTG